MSTNSVIEEIANERRRQIEAEGWTPKHDDKHDRGELARAAAAYAYHAGGNTQIDVVGKTLALPYFHIGWFLPAGALWPFERHWWKPRTPRATLIKSAAMIVAEIERLDRAASRPARTET